MRMTGSKYVRCIACGWVHYAVTLEHAVQAVADFNAYAQRAGLEQLSALESYMTCRKCGADTARFVGFVPERELGFTMQPVVVER